MPKSPKKGDDSQSILDAAFAAVEDYLVQQPPSKDTEMLDPRDQTRDQADKYVLVIRTLLQQRRGVGTALLYAGWRFYSQGLMTAYGVGPEEFYSWFTETFADPGNEESDTDNCTLIKRIAFLIVRILAPVHGAELTGKPYLDSEGKPLTVERLLETRDIVHKGTHCSYVFDKLEGDKDSQAKLLESIINDTRTEVLDTMDSLSGNSRIKYRSFKYRLVEKGNGTVDVVFADIEIDQANALIAMLGSAAEEFANELSEEEGR